jgi:dUTP pyrophosphatase
VLGNGTGVIDADYEGPLMVSAWNRDDANPVRIEPGDRIAQLVFTRVTRPVLTVLEDESASRSGRGAGGFGSSGR